MAQMSPFQLFGMKPAFMIDEAKLEAVYQAAMMKVHPHQRSVQAPQEPREARGLALRERRPSDRG